MPSIISLRLSVLLKMVDSDLLWKMAAWFVVACLSCRRRDPAMEIGSLPHEGRTEAGGSIQRGHSQPIAQFFLRLRKNGSMQIPRPEYSLATVSVDLAPAAENQTAATIHFYLRFYIGGQLHVLEGAMQHVVGEQQGHLFRCAIGYGLGGVMNMARTNAGAARVERFDNLGLLFSVSGLELCSVASECVMIELLRVRAAGYTNLLEVPRAISIELDEDRDASPTAGP